MNKIEYWKNKLEIIKSKNPNLILDRCQEYHTIREKIELGCPNHKNIYWFKININHILDSKLNCPLCSGKDKSNLQETIEEQFPNCFNFSKFEYINALTPFTLICKKCNNEFNIIYNNLKGSKGCPYCNNTINLTAEQWRVKATILRGEDYDYSESEYINNYTPVKILCKKCGNYFYQNPYNHLTRKNNCSCYSKKHKLTTEDFINKANLIHNNKYDYSSANYINNKTKIKIICPIHGEFEQLPSSHLQGHGCPICARPKKKELIVKKHKLTTEEFIERAKKCHTIKYDYSLVNYINKETKIKIICPVHGLFEQRAGTHLLGCNCPKCAKSIGSKKSNIKFKKTTEQFIFEAKLVHGNKYDYSITNYANKLTKVKIICPIHGIFEQRPDSHLNGNGCPICKESKGERTIRLLLENNNINYIPQMKFDNLADKLKLSYDFYLKDYNLLIEYNGIQHYEISFNKAYKDFLIQKHHDWLKRKYARDNGINLLIISYKDKIKEKILNAINNCTRL